MKAPHLLARAVGFASRHRWSIGFSLASSYFFFKLASEVKERELGAFDSACLTGISILRGRADALMLGLTFLGNGSTLAPIVLVIVIALTLIGRRHAALFLAVAAGGSLLLNALLKWVFQRARPGIDALYLSKTPASFSFPSGHAQGATGVLLSLIVLVFALRVARGWRIAAVSVGGTLIFGISLSRVYLGVHYASDVLAGLLAGAAWVSAITGWFYPRLIPGEAAVEPA